MKYKLLHKLFGWDYVQWYNTADSGIARVEVSPDGTVYYWRYRLTKVLDVLHHKSRVHWLTCSKDKYLPSEVAEVSSTTKQPSEPRASKKTGKAA